MYAAGLLVCAVLGGCTLFSGVADLKSDAGVGGAGEGGAEHTTGAGAGGPTGGTAAGGASGSGTNSGGSSSASSAGAGGPTCVPSCGSNQYCEGATSSCVCNPGYTKQGGACVAAPPGDPSTHTQQDVCDHWAKGHIVTEPSPLVASGMACDPGTLKQAAIVDTLVRLNMFRWMVGLGPTSDDPALDVAAQKCANLEAFWDFNSPGSPHSPPASSKCYTPEGGATAGQSNIAWGSGSPAQGIDQFMQDNGNATTMGHRRWIVNPPLDPVGIGYWQTGGQYGNAECLRVFGASGAGPKPPWVSIPATGFTPVQIAQWTWTFHGSLQGIPAAKVAVLRVDDNTPMPVSVQVLQQGFGQDAVAWTRNNWNPEAGKTYRVTVSGLTGGDVVYDVKPVVCN